MQNLYLFITSERSDQYLNPIIHCLKLGIRKVIFVEVIKPQGKQVKAKIMCENVYNFANKLSDGYYINKNQELIDLSKCYPVDKLENIKLIYKQCSLGYISWDHESIHYNDLKTYINALSKQKEKSIVDLTCVSKSYLVDIVLCCLLYNLDSVYSFELILEKLKFEEPWTMLIHELTDGQDYLYVNLVKTSIVHQISNLITFRTLPTITLISVTVLCVLIALIINFWIDNDNAILSVLNIVATILTISSYCLYFIPLRK